MLKKHGLRTLLTAGVTAVLAFSIAAVALGETQVEKQVAPGVKLIEMQRNSSDGIPWTIYVLKMDRHAKNLSFRATKGRDHVIGTNTVRKQAAGVSTTGEVIAAINADFYDMDDPFAGLPCGMVVRDGEFMCGTSGGWPSFSFDANGNPQVGLPKMVGTLQIGNTKETINTYNKFLGAEGTSDFIALYTSSFALSTRGESEGTDVIMEGIDPSLPLKAGVTYSGTVKEVRTNVKGSPIYSGCVVLAGRGKKAQTLAQLTPGTKVQFNLSLDPDWSHFDQITGCWPVLLKDSKIQSQHFTSELENKRYPRTGIGWNKDQLLFVVVDGREEGHSMGMNLSEFAQMMLDLGCTDSVNMDGGGSTTLVVRGRVVNQPSDGSDRSVSVGWAVVNDAKAGKLADLQVFPQSQSILCGSHLALQVSGRDANGAPVKVDPKDVKWSVEPEVGSVDSAGIYTATPISRSGQVVAKVGSIREACSVNVWDKPASVYIAQGTLQLKTNQSSQLSLQAWDTDNEPLVVDPSAITWKVDGAGVTISPDGKVLASTQAGDFHVTATVAGVSATLDGSVSK